jgi:hypothetical protein
MKQINAVADGREMLEPHIYRKAQLRALGYPARLRLRRGGVAELTLESLQRPEERWGHCLSDARSWRRSQTVESSTLTRGP